MRRVVRPRTTIAVGAVIIVGLVGAGLWWTGSSDRATGRSPALPGPSASVASPTALSPPFTTLVVRAGDEIGVISLPGGASRTLSLPAGATQVHVIEPAIVTPADETVRLIGVAGGRSFSLDVGAAAPGPDSSGAGAGGSVVRVLPAGQQMAVVSVSGGVSVLSVGGGTPVIVPAGWTAVGLAAPGAEAGADAGQLDVVLTRPSPSGQAGLVSLARWYPGNPPLPIATAAHLVAVGRGGQVVWVDPGCPVDAVPTRPLGVGGCALHMGLPSGPNPTETVPDHVAAAPEGAHLLAASAAVGPRGVVAAFATLIGDPQVKVAVLADPQRGTSHIVTGSQGAVPGAGVVWSARGDVVFVVRGADGDLHPAFLAPGATRVRVLEVTLTSGTTLLAVRGEVVRAGG